MDLNKQGQKLLMLHRVMMNDLIRMLQGKCWVLAKGFAEWMERGSCIERNVTIGYSTYGMNFEILYVHSLCLLYLISLLMLASRDA